jgi:large subunit ribosomal protein L25
MKAVELEVQPREAKKRNRAKAIRSAGRVPGIVYGGGENHLVEVDNKTFESIVHSASSDTVLVELKHEGKNRLALVQEVQHHPLSRQALHIDFREVKPDQEVVVILPTIPKGEPEGVKTEGGNLEHVLHYLKVKGTPSNLPESFEIDVTHLEIGQTFPVRDIVTPEGVEVLADPSNAVFSITRPRVIEEPVAVEGEEGEELAEGEEAAEGETPVEGEASAGGDGGKPPAGDGGK